MVARRNERIMNFFHGMLQWYSDDDDDDSDDDDTQIVLGNPHTLWDISIEMCSKLAWVDPERN